MFLLSWFVVFFLKEKEVQCFSFFLLISYLFTIVLKKRIGLLSQEDMSPLVIALAFAALLLNVHSGEHPSTSFIAHSDLVSLLRLKLYFVTFKMTALTMIDNIIG